MRDLIRRLADLVAAPSPSREEGPAVDVVEGWAALPAASPVRTLRRDRNLAAFRVAARPGPTVLLCSHTDTVPPTSSWTRDPFAPALEAHPGGERLYGLGANDAKGCVTAMMEAFRAAPIRRGTLIAAMVCEEETGRNGLEAFLPHLPPIHHAIVGEPTGLRVATAQNGMLILDCVAHGRAGHAARPWLADNAILRAARDIQRLTDLRLDRLHPVAGATTLAVTMISAGTRHNVIPDRCQFTLDLRTTAAYTHDGLTDTLRALLESEVGVRSDRFHPVETPEGSPLLAAALRACPGEPFASPTLSDWAHLRGTDAIKWGPGLSEVSHTADEWIEAAMVERAAGAYAQVISELLG